MNLHAHDAFFCFSGLEVQSRSAADGYGLLLQINCVLALCFFFFFAFSTRLRRMQRSGAAHPSQGKKVKLFNVTWAMSQRSQNADETNKNGGSGSRRWTLEWYVNLDLVNSNNKNNNRDGDIDEKAKIAISHGGMRRWRRNFLFACPIHTVTHASRTSDYLIFLTRRWHWNFHKMKRK